MNYVLQWVGLSQPYHKNSSGPEWTIVSWTVKKNMSVLTQLDFPRESQAVKNRDLYV